MKKMPIAIFPGTFDPITCGHVELITRAAYLFQHLIIAIAFNPNKKTLFSLEERVAMAEKALVHLDNVKVLGFSELMANFAEKQEATVLVRGVRNINDFEYERQLADINRHLKSDLETIFLMSSPEMGFISSSMVKDVALHHGDITRMVPEHVATRLLNKLQQQSTQ